MEEDLLHELGLTPAEATAYLALLKLGSTSAGDIREESALQNSVLHRALNSLIEKGFVSYIYEGRRRTYQASDPKFLFELLEERKEHLEKIYPRLKALQDTARTQEQALVYKGIKGLKEVYHHLINLEAKEYLTFGGGPITAEVMGMSWWLNLHTRRIAKKLPSRQVFDESVRALGSEIISKPLTRVRFLPSEFAQFQETVIVGNSVGICIFTDNPYGILIKDASVAQGYRKHFEVLWQASKQ